MSVTQKVSEFVNFPKMDIVLVCVRLVICATHWPGTGPQRKGELKAHHIDGVQMGNVEELDGRSR